MTWMREACALTGPIHRSQSGLPQKTALNYKLGDSSIPSIHTACLVRFPLGQNRGIPKSAEVRFKLWLPVWGPACMAGDWHSARIEEDQSDPALLAEPRDST